MELSMLAAQGAESGAKDAHDDMSWMVRSSIQRAHEKNMQNRQFKMSKSLNTQMAELSRDARQMSASDQVVGLRAAGLNPALAQGAQFGSVASGGGVSAPSSSTPYASTPRASLGKLAMEELRYKESERDLMASQAELNRAAAEEHRANTGPKSIEEQNLKSENEMANSLIQDWVDRHIDSQNPDEKATALFMREQNEAYTTGSLRALNAWMQFTADQKHRAMEIARDEYEKRIYDLRNTNDVARVIYDLPKHERNAIISDIMKTQQELLNLRSQKDLTEQQIESFKAQAAEVTARAAKIYHTDPAAMWDNKDWRNLLLYGGEKVVDGALDVAGGTAKVKAAKYVIQSGQKPDLSNVKYYDYPRLKVEQSPLNNLR